MSYDIHLTERVSGETIKLPIKHMMTGGTYQADCDERTKTFSPAAIQDAWLNITYNYSRYYYEAAEGDERFYGVEDRNDDGYHNCGIRGIYGKTGLDSIPMLRDLASRINSDYWTSTAGNAIKPLYQLLVFAELRPDGVWDGD